MSFSIITYKDEQHENNSHCESEKSFSIVRIAVDLSKWKDYRLQGVEISIRKLMQHEFLGRVILTNPVQVKFLNFHWRLTHILHKMFKRNWATSGFINLRINSVPPTFDGYPNEAKHTIWLEALTHASPILVMNSEDFFKEQIQLFYTGRNN